jgi:16S rRNA (cytosine1402-N4)-methyltransferase
MTYSHRPVLLDEAVLALIENCQSLAPVFLDGTFGRGGHSQKILQCLSPNGKLLATDKDPQAISVGRTIVDSRFQIFHQSFSHMNEVAGKESLDGILLDLGISSPQVDDGQRGFSFRLDGPLDMRMNNTEGISAADWLAHATEKEITKVIKEYGEERFALSIAKAIVISREQGGALRTTRQLASLVASVVRSREPGQDPATRTFQALRIFINQELADLEAGLSMAINLLKPGGRLVVISFHSLEDRIVKQFIQSKSKISIPRGLPIREADLPKPILKEIKRVKPSSEEVKSNPRSRSAILRVAEKVGSLA